MEIVYFITLSLYLIIGVKVDQYVTIYTMGYKTEVPLAFLQYPNIYKLVSGLLFFCNLIILIFIDNWVLGLLILAVVWFIVGKIGHKNAFKNHREALRDLLENEKSEEMRSQLKTELEKNDSQFNEELMERVRINRRLN